MASQNDTIKVLFVDDDDLVAQIVRITLEQAGGFKWLGQLRDAGELAALARLECPDIVMLDLCMPGKCPFAAMRELAETCPEARVLMFSACDSESLIDRAIEAGAAGYLGKDANAPLLTWALRRVAEGEFVMGAQPLTCAAER